ncbi:MAG: leucine-rich repeat domain-containing protein [Acidobacteriota bacterium]
MKTPQLILFGTLVIPGILHAQDVSPTERSALLALYDSTDGQNWTNNQNWLDPQATVDTWYGVLVESGHIVALDLSDNNLKGAIAPELENLENLQELRLGGNQLSGVIPKEIGYLINLRVLSLEVNQLSGPVPPELGQLENLEELYLYTNDLDHQIPPELGNLVQLRVLLAYQNGFTGSIPKELGSLAALEVVFLSTNSLSGEIPSELGNLTALHELYLTNNELSGPIPDSLSSLAALRTLDLSGNHLAGTIPGSLGGLTDLETLILSDNELGGPIPGSFGQLADLKILRLSHNRLSGTIPASLNDLTQLQTLSLSNNQLSGAPPNLGQLTHLVSLDLSGNSLQGAIPASWTGLTELRNLDLSGNNLDGTLPPDLGALNQLRSLSLSDNAFSGPIPTSLGQFEQLRYCSFGGNRLTGGIPTEMGNLSRLETLALNDNQLSGDMPAELTQLTGLRRLSLEDNDLSGSIPPSLGELSALTILDLSGNQFSGTVPDSIGQLQQLEYLNLAGHQSADSSTVGLSGEVPTSLWQLPRLRYLDLSRNRLSGSLPSSVSGLPSLERLDISENAFAGSIPADLFEHPLLRELHLDQNQFSGALPEGLAKFILGPALDLTGNRFEGQVPADLFLKPGLTVLNLAGNRFSSLPATLASDSDLQVLNLAHDQIGPQIEGDLFAHLPQLRMLNLQDNRLVSAPDLSHSSELEVLNLARNEIRQEFPSQWTELSNLRILSIRSNQFHGTIPDGILNLTNLREGSSDFRGNLLQTSDPQVEAFMSHAQVGGSWKVEFLFPYYSERTSSAWDFTSFAFSNPMPSGVGSIMLEQFGAQGEALANASVQLQPGEQKALLGREFWLCAEPGPGCAASAPGDLVFDGWVRVTLDSEKERGFFLFTDGEGMMDGGLPARESARHLVFTRVRNLLRGQLVQTTLSLINPYSEQCGIDLRLRDSTGSIVSETSRSLGALSVLRAPISDLFGSVANDGDYLTVDVTNGTGIAGFETLRADPPGTLLGLSPWTDSTATLLYSAQVAYIPDVLYTNLHLVNSGAEAAQVELSIYDDSGLVTDSTALQLQPGSAWIGDLQDVFGLSSTTIGSLLVRSDAPGVIGDVLFLQANLDYAAAMQLEAEPTTLSIFSQVANVGSFSTGLALFNPGEVKVSGTLRVFDASGHDVGQFDFMLDPFSRFSDSLSSLVPESATQVGGYIKVESDNPIVAEEIFVQANKIYVAVPTSK